MNRGSDAQLQGTENLNLSDLLLILLEGVCVPVISLDMTLSSFAKPKGSICLLYKYYKAQVFTISCLPYRLLFMAMIIKSVYCLGGLLAQFSLHVHKGGLNPHSFHFVCHTGIYQHSQYGSALPHQMIHTVFVTTWYMVFSRVNFDPV